MIAPRRADECPDPDSTIPVIEPMLRTLEEALVVQFRAGASGTDSNELLDAEMDAALRDYVEYLHLLGCSPEHVIMHVKRRLDDATFPNSVSGRKRREAIVLRAIRVYFGAT